MTPDPVDIIEKAMNRHFVFNGQAVVEALKAAGYRIVGPDEVVVPREPTEEMIEAGGHTDQQDNGYEDAIVIYKAMIKEANRDDT